MKLRTILILLATGLLGLFVGRSVTLSSTPGPAEEPPVHHNSNLIVDEVRFDGTPISKAIDALRDKTHANIVVRWERINLNRGVTPEHPVTLRLEQVSLSTVLHHLLADIPAGLAFSEGDDGVIVISTQDDLPQEAVLRFYDISDLLRLSMEDDARSRRNRVTLFGPPRDHPPTTQEFTGAVVDPDDPPTEVEFADSIIKLIQDTVASDQWRDNGGSVGSIREINGLLIVSIGSPQQEQIRQLLDKTRAMLRERDARPLEKKLRATTAPTGAP